MEDEEACGAAVTLALRLQLYDPRRWSNFGHPLIMITAGPMLVEYSAKPKIILFILTNNNIIVKVHLRFW